MLHNTFGAGLSRKYDEEARRVIHTTELWGVGTTLDRMIAVQVTGLLSALRCILLLSDMYCQYKLSIHTYQHTFSPPSHLTIPPPVGAIGAICVIIRDDARHSVHLQG